MNTKYPLAALATVLALQLLSPGLTLAGTPQSAATVSTSPAPTSPTTPSATPTPTPTPAQPTSTATATPAPAPISGPRANAVPPTTSTPTTEQLYNTLTASGWSATAIAPLTDEQWVAVLKLYDQRNGTKLSGGAFEEANQGRPYIDAIEGKVVDALEARRCVAALSINTCAYAQNLSFVARDRSLASHGTSQATQWNGKGDAFRHCYWTGLMTQKQSATVAAIIGDIHEDHASRYKLQPIEEKNMDLFNNAFGRRVGAMYSDQESVARYCFQASNNGSLKTLR